jgi:hypothetical protein
LAFDRCLGLTGIAVNINNPNYSSLNGVLFDKNQTTLVIYPPGGAASYNIPDGVTTIGSEAFIRCYTITNIEIPASVTSIRDGAFYQCASLTGVVLPDGVTNIGDYAFYSCTSLACIIIPNGVTDIGSYVFSDCASLTNVTIPDSVTSIGDAFDGCTSLTSITIPSHVSNLGSFAFNYCANLQQIYFSGNAPDYGYPYVFYGTPNVTVYYLPNATGWDTEFVGQPTALWLPQMQTTGDSFGVKTNQFGLNINWASGQTVVVEASTNLINWQPLQTNTLTTGSAYFSDPQWTNYPSRFYRLRSP